MLGKDSSLFPLPASALYSNYILSFRPAELKSTHADIKHSSYKKLGGLMKDVVKRGWISAKEVKGDWVVASVNPHHDECVVGFKTPFANQITDSKLLPSASKQCDLTGQSMMKIMTGRPLKQIRQHLSPRFRSFHYTSRADSLDNSFTFGKLCE